MKRKLIMAGIVTIIILSAIILMSPHRVKMIVMSNFFRNELIVKEGDVIGSIEIKKINNWSVKVSGGGKTIKCEYDGLYDFNNLLFGMNLSVPVYTSFEKNIK